MIAKISRGWRIGGLVRYLMGPGRFNEHSGQRIVAAWDGDPDAHQPQQRGDGAFDVADLAAALADPGVAAGIPQRTPPVRPDGRVPRGPVWHCSLRNAAADEPLTDQQWAEIVEDLMDRTGIAGRGDPGACRWVAIRHGPDHVHIAAMLVRQDNGRRVHPRHDYARAREACRDAEQRLGLTATAPADRTAPAPGTRAEQEKAARRGVDEPSRDWLRRCARLGAVQARDAETFFAQLRDLGVLVRPRTDPDGTPVGYAIAAPGDTTADGQPVWYGGGSLAADLTLPTLAQRWASAPAPPDPIPAAETERSTVGQQERDTAVDEAASSIEAATAALRERAPADDEQRADGEPVEDETGDAVAHATGDMLEAIGAATTDQRCPDARQRQRVISDSYDRVARAAGTVLPRRWAPVAAELRRAAWRLAAIRGTGRDTAAGLRLVAALAALVAEIAALREQQHRLAQAGAARRTVAHLTPPGGAPTQSPVAAGSRPGRRADAVGPGRTPTGTRARTPAPATSTQPRPPGPQPGRPVQEPPRRRSRR